jgi:light-regulated signal transduction histidine kinase (bacteriophytochrome)
MCWVAMFTLRRVLRFIHLQTLPHLQVTYERFSAQESDQSPILYHRHLIDPADVPHLFERFYRADRARSRQGTGLGLPIAQTLAEQLGGRITVESTPGKGSTFSVWLPLA